MIERGFLSIGMFIVESFLSPHLLLVLRNTKDSEEDALRIVLNNLSDLEDYCQPHAPGFYNILVIINGSFYEYILCLRTYFMCTYFFFEFK